MAKAGLMVRHTRNSIDKAGTDLGDRKSVQSKETKTKKTDSQLRSGSRDLIGSSSNVAAGQNSLDTYKNSMFSN